MLEKSKSLLKKGFTLAETLITMTIVGIVAVMVMGVIRNIQESEWKEAWKKEFSTIVQAYERIKQEEGGDLTSYFLTQQGAMPLLVKMSNYITVYQRCNYSSYVCGISPNVDLDTAYKTLSGKYVHNANLSYIQFVLKNGINFYGRSYTPSYTIIFIDVNGYPKGPNVLGKDLLGMIMTKDKIVPMGADDTSLENSCNKTSIGCPYSRGFDDSGGLYDCAGAGCSAEFLSR